VSSMQEITRLRVEAHVMRARGWLTLKAASDGDRPHEFEYPIHLAMAKACSLSRRHRLSNAALALIVRCGDWSGRCFCRGRE